MVELILIIINNADLQTHFLAAVKFSMKLAPSSINLKVRRPCEVREWMITHACYVVLLFVRPFF